MKALQLKQVGRLEMIDAPAPRPGEDQLLVRTGAAVICTSDLNDIRENPFGISLPVIMGHEAAGTVVQVGPKAKGFAVGDRVAAHPVHPCGQCVNCRDGVGHLCLAMGHFGLNMQGTFAEYFVVRHDRARKIPDGVPFPTAALAEPVSVCLEGLSQARLQRGQCLLIIGDGPFGVLTALLAEREKLSGLVIAGHHDWRMAFAPAAKQVNIKGLADPAEALLAANGGRKYDAVFLGVGRAAAVQQGLALLKPKGRLVVFSAIPQPTPVDLFSLHCKELEIVGACNDQDRLDEAVGMLSDASIGLGRLVTHHFPIERYQEAIDLAANGHEKAMKVALTFGQEA